MNNIIAIRLLSLPGVYIFVLVLFLLSACAPQQAVTKPLLPSAVRVIPVSTVVLHDLEDPGRIIVADGNDCGESDLSGEEVVVEMEGSFELPSYADKGTVFLNGWKMSYLNGDHHVRWIGVRINDVEQVGSTLRWLASGGISDDDFNNGYSFCYYYTAIGWNSGTIDAVSGPAADTLHINDNDDTALTTLFGYAQGDELEGRATVAMLPRGFQLGFANESWAFPFDFRWPPACFDCPVDHHILQLSYNLEHNLAFLEKGKKYDTVPSDAPDTSEASRVDQRFTSWNSYEILKDNSLRRDAWVDEHLFVLAGNDIDYIRPPFAVLPKENISGFNVACIGEAAGVKSQEIEIRNLPYDYAIPVLSGWALRYGCDDEHVLEAGIWLEDVEYEKDTDEAAGTLRYTLMSTLRDNNGQPGHIVNHKVNILGINARQPSDLLPQSDNPQFCSKDSQGRLLLGVANIGDDDAPATTMRIRFELGTTVNVLTPPLPKGFTVNLDPIEIPPASCSGDCDFTIFVDVDNEAVETNEINNIADGFCVG